MAALSNAMADTSRLALPDGRSRSASFIGKVRGRPGRAGRKLRASKSDSETYGTSWLSEEEEVAQVGEWVESLQRARSVDFGKRTLRIPTHSERFERHAQGCMRARELEAAVLLQTRAALPLKHVGGATALIVETYVDANAPRKISLDGPVAEGILRRHRHNDPDALAPLADFVAGVMDQNFREWSRSVPRVPA